MGNSTQESIRQMNLIDEGNENTQKNMEKENKKENKKELKKVASNRSINQQTGHKQERLES